MLIKLQIHTSEYSSIDVIFLFSQSFYVLRSSEVFCFLLSWAAFLFPVCSAFWEHQQFLLTKTVTFVTGWVLLKTSPWFGSRSLNQFSWDAMSPVCGRDLVVFLRLSSQSAAGSGLGTTSMPLQGSVSLIRFLWYLHLADIFGYWIILRQYHLQYKGINIYYQYISSQFFSLQSHYVFKTCSDLTSTGFKYTDWLQTDDSFNHTPHFSFHWRIIS